MGIMRSDDGFEIDYPRKLIVIAAKSAGIEAFDTPYTKFKDIDGLKRDIFIAKRLGFSGKFAIHPSQIDLKKEINKIGEFPLSINLHSDLVAELHVLVEKKKLGK